MNEAIVGHGPCPVSGCTLALITSTGLNVTPVCSAHGAPPLDGGVIQFVPGSVVLDNSTGEFSYVEAPKCIVPDVVNAVTMHHSADLVEVYHGYATPSLACGFHASYYMGEVNAARRALEVSK